MKNLICFLLSCSIYLDSCSDIPCDEDTCTVVEEGSVADDSISCTPFLFNLSRLLIGNPIQTYPKDSLSVSDQVH